MATKIAEYTSVERFDIYKNLLLCVTKEKLTVFEDGGKVKFESKGFFNRMTFYKSKVVFQEKSDPSIAVLDLDSGKTEMQFDMDVYLNYSFIEGDNLFVMGNECVYKVNMLSYMYKKLELKELPKIITGSKGCSHFGRSVFCMDLETTIKIWEQKISDKVNGLFANSSNEIVVVLNNKSLVAFSSASGNMLWILDSRLSFYSQHHTNKKFYGYGGETYEIIDIDKGAIQLQKKFEGSDEKYGIRSVSNMSKVYEDGLYFISNFSGGKFGKINIGNHEIEYVQELNFTSGVSGNIPVPYKDQVYILDSEKKLHVFAKN